MHKIICVTLLVMVLLAHTAQAQEETITCTVTFEAINSTSPFPFSATGDIKWTEETHNDVTTMTASMCPSRYDIADENERSRMRGMTMGMTPRSAIVAMGRPADEMQKAWADRIVNVRITPARP